jgi:hypothetical protein
MERPAMKKLDIALPAELEARLKAEAARRGIAAEELAAILIKEELEKVTGAARLPYD